MSITEHHLAQIGAATITILAGIGLATLIVLIVERIIGRAS